MRLRRATAVVLIAGLLAVTGPPTANATPGGPAGPGAGNGPAEGRVEVTLVTGDRLVLRAGADGAVATDGRTPVVATIPASGRADVRFTVRRDGKDTYVVPSDALGLVGSRRVDERLFNVSALVRDGLHDGARTSVPVILTHNDGRAARAPAGAATGRALPSIGASTAEVTKDGAAAFWTQITGGAKSPRTLAAGAGRLWLDGTVRATLDRSVAQIGAPQAWAAGHTGAGTTVAVLDSGIDTSHPDLVDAVVGAQDFTDGGSTGDRYGHGTHVAGIITGDGSASGGRYRGVAPDAKLLNGKVLNDFGSGSESDVIAGMEWAAGQGADVINMSLGNDTPSAGDRPIELALNELSRSTGALFVVSAGNSGPDPGTIGSPAAADAALTVGAVDRSDAVAEFSGRGPRSGDNGLKPDITAPGVGIVAPLAAGSVIADRLPAVDGRYVALDGTSMAAPHVAGAAAILAGQHRDWDATVLKPALMASARPTPGASVFEQGAGRVDVARAVGLSLWSSPASINNGTVAWPHGDDAPIARDITYHNAGTAPVTLTLAVDVDSPAGQFTVTPEQLTVPAGATATATLTTDTRVPAPDRRYAGAVVATGGGSVVRTTFAVDREVESYDIDISVIDHDGRPTSSYGVGFVDVAVRRGVFPYDESGRVVARVPKGTHYLEATVSAADYRISVFVEPSFVVTGPATLLFDARTAKPPGATLDRPEARAADGAIGFFRTTDWGVTGVTFLGRLDGVFVQPSATSAPADLFSFHVRGIYARPDGAGGFDGSPYLYRVEWSHRGRVPTDLLPVVHDKDLATSRTEIAATRPGQVVNRDWLFDVQVPGTFVDRSTPGLPWYSAMFGVGPDGEYEWYESAPPRTYALGKTVTERWNRGVHAVALPAAEDAGSDVASRTGDVVSLYLPVYSGQSAGHFGTSYSDPITTTLRRNGTVVGEANEPWARFPVAAEAGDYRLTTTVTHTTDPVRTRMDAAWTFRSARPSGTEPVLLPLMAIRFAPDLDRDNTAPAGRPFVVPVSIERQGGGDYGRPQRLTVEVSYDDGATWRPAPVAGTGDRRTVVLGHPRGAGFVSLRSSVSDSRGNTAELTVIRAYALR